MIDDKVTLLAAMKRVLGTALTTVFVRQGHYAQQFDDAEAYAAIDPAPDLAIARIADLIDHDPADFLPSPGVAITDMEPT